MEIKHRRCGQDPARLKCVISFVQVEEVCYNKLQLLLIIKSNSRLRMCEKRHHIKNSSQERIKDFGEFRLLNNSGQITLFKLLITHLDHNIFFSRVNALNKLIKVNDQNVSCKLTMFSLLLSSQCTSTSVLIKPEELSLWLLS